LKTRFLLIVLYVGFVVTSLVYLWFANQWQAESRIDLHSIAELRANADAATDVKTAQQTAKDSILMLEMRAADQLLADSLSRLYLLFALVSTLPLVGYAGQTMRSKLFINRPEDMPRLVYWTLFGVSTRATAVRYMWLSVTLAYVSAVAALFVTIGYLGLFSLVTAYLYQNAIQWVDKNSHWANKTNHPFPLS
jgi:hypothetical protein